MKAKFLPVVLFASLAVQAQNAKQVFSITDKTPGGMHWSSIRQVNAPKKGMEANQILLDGRQVTKKLAFDNGAKPVTNGDYFITPLATGSAALGFSKKSNRLYFAPMYNNKKLYFVDLEDKDQNLHIIEYTANAPLSNDREAQNITRMVITKGGNGYALSNDGSNFLKFSTKGNVEVTNLGGLVNDPANGEMDLTKRQNGWGGDIIASSLGHLYMFTMKNTVYKIDVSTRVATYMGTITGLDNGFTINGAAVTDNGDILLSSAAMNGKKAIMKDIDKLEANMELDPTWVNASDLATCNDLSETSSVKLIELLEKPDTKTDAISIYPNPITNGNLTVTFLKTPKGVHSVDILNASGKVVTTKVVNVQTEGQQERFNLSTRAKGMYYVRVTNGSKAVFSAKAVLQ